ncbi:MAG: acyclic terpene utilization AtuA family protein, partial [Micromonosporaceae bacterium]
IECGAQATGGNYSHFTELADLRRPGFPIAELHPDGSSVITKHDGTGGAVTVGTVTAQLLYEIAGARYPGPDVTARVDTVELTQEGPDRVQISGVRGEPPPPQLKVGVNALGGFRNEVGFVLTGLDIEQKAALAREQMEAALGSRRPAHVRWTLARADHPDADVQEEASALLRLVVRDPDPELAGRAVSRAGIELALASYPGFHVTAPPADASPYGVFTAAYVDPAEVAHVAVLPDGRRVTPSPPSRFQRLEELPPPELPEPAISNPEGAGVPTRRVPLGVVVGARSGDKGGSCNVGVWAHAADGPPGGPERIGATGRDSSAERDSRARLDAAERDARAERVWRWLVRYLSVAEFARLLPETAAHPITRHVLPNLRALNFVVDGLLGEGVASQARFDPQAKAVGEWLRSRHVDIPEGLL